MIKNKNTIKDFSLFPGLSFTEFEAFVNSTKNGEAYDKISFPIKLYILNQLSRSDQTSSELINNCPVKISKNDMDKALADLVASENANLKDNNKYENMTISFRDFVIASLSAKDNKQILEYRLDGKTLIEIGNIYGLSKEAIRQKEKIAIQKVLDIAPENYIFSDVRYMGLFKKGVLSDKFANYESKQNKEFFGARYYYRQVCKKPIVYAKRKENIISSINTFKAVIDEIDPDLYNDIKEKFLLVPLEDDVAFIPSSKKISLHILESEGPMTATEVKESYDKVVMNNPKIARDKRYFRQTLLLDPSVIRTEGKKIRYYNIDKYKNKILDVLNSLDLSNLPTNKKISIDMLFENNKEKLKQIDIRNGIELHGLLRRNKDNVSLKLTLWKLPIIEIKK